MSAAEEARGEPGAAFLVQRLAAAAAVPAGQRTPELSAFLEFFELTRQVVEKLPGVLRGAAAAEASEEQQRASSLALLRYLRAQRLCPQGAPDHPLAANAALGITWLLQPFLLLVPYTGNMEYCWPCCSTGMHSIAVQPALARLLQHGQWPVVDSRSDSDNNSDGLSDSQSQGDSRSCSHSDSDSHSDSQSHSHGHSHSHSDSQPSIHMVLKAVVVLTKLNDVMADAAPDPAAAAAYWWEHQAQLGLRLTAALLQEPLGRQLRQQLSELQEGLSEPLVSLDELLTDCIDMKHVAALLWAKQRVDQCMRRVISGELDAHAQPVPPASSAWRQVWSQREADSTLLVSLQLPGGYRGLVLAAEYGYDWPGLQEEPEQARVALERLRRAREAAAAAGSDYWVARTTYQLVLGESINLQHGIRSCAPPAKLLEWLDEADAACRRCRRLLPRLWTAALVDMRHNCSSKRMVLQTMAAEGAAEPAADAGTAGERTWQAEEVFGQAPSEADRQLDDACLERARQVVEVEEARRAAQELLGSYCSGCGHVCSELRKCSACRQAQYCR